MKLGYNCDFSVLLVRVRLKSTFKVQSQFEIRFSNVDVECDIELSLRDDNIVTLRYLNGALVWNELFSCFLVEEIFLEVELCSF